VIVFGDPRRFVKKLSAIKSLNTLRPLESLARLLFLASPALKSAYRLAPLLLLVWVFELLLTALEAYEFGVRFAIEPYFLPSGVSMQHNAYSCL